MNLLSRLRDFLLGETTPPSTSTLRNKPGGMAWVRGVPAGYGAEALNGRVVKTVRLNEEGSWDIEPPQFYICTASGTLFPSFVQLWPGKTLRQTGIDDVHLEPIPDTGVTTEEVRELYAPTQTETA